MAMFRKKPVVIEAVQITNNTFDAPHPNPEHIIGLTYDPVQRQVLIPTLEGTMIGNVGDWIITGVNGEHYLCKPDIFEKTYRDENAAVNILALGMQCLGLAPRSHPQSGWNIHEPVTDDD